MGRLPRAALRVTGFALLVFLALVVVAYLPPTQRAVARWAEARTSQALHARVQIGSLSYDLARLRVTARDVRISQDLRDAAAWFEAAEVAVDVPWSALRGRLRFQSIELTRPRLNLDALETWLDARPKGEGKRLDRLDVDRVAIRDLALAGYPDSAPFSIEIEQFSTESTSVGGRFTAPVQARGGSLRLGPYVTGLESVSGTLHYDGQRIVLSPLRVRTDWQEVEATGDIGLLGEAPAWNLDLTLDGDVGPVLASWPEVPAAAGKAHVTGRVTGPLGSPQVDLQGAVERLVFAGVEARAVKVTTRISGAGVAVEQVSLTALGGHVAGRLTVPFGAGRPDQASITWSGVDLAALLRAVDAPVHANARTDGSATLAGALADPRGWTLDAAARLISADSARAGARGQPRLSIKDGRWSLQMSQGQFGATDVTVDLQGRLPEAGDRAVARSSLQGTASLTTGDVAETMAWLSDAGIAVPGEARDLVSGPLSLAVTLGGTVASPAVSTRFAQQTLNVRDLGPVTLDGPLRFADRTRLDSDGLTATLAGGRLTATGFADLSGPLQLDLDARDLGLPQLGRLIGANDWLPRAGVVSATGRLAGTSRMPQASLDLRARDVEWLGQRLDEVAGPIRAAGRVLSSDKLDVRAGDGRATISGSVDIGRDAFDARVSASAFPMRPLVLPDRSPIDLAGTADLSFAGKGTFAAPNGGGRLTVAGLRVDGVQPGAVEADLVLEGNGFGRADVKVPDLTARASVRLAVARPWTYEATADVGGLDVRRAARMAGVPEQTASEFAGTLVANARATGRLDRLEEPDLTLTVERFDGTAFALPLRIESPAVVRVNATEIGTDGLEVISGTSRARLQGRLARDTSGGTLGLHAEGAIADFAPLIERFAGTKASATGQFVADITASGTRTAPKLAGSLDVRDGRVELQDRPAITGLAATASLGDGRLEITSVRAELGTGVVEARGSLPLHQLSAWLPESITSANPSSGASRIQGSIRNLDVGSVLALAGRPPAGDLTGSFDATIDLASDRPVADALTGTVLVERASATLKEVTIAQDTPAAIQVRNGVATFDEWRWKGARTDMALRGTVGFTATPVTYDVEVRGPIDVSVVGTVIPGRTAGQLRADLRVRQVDGKPAVNGEVFVTRGAWVDRGLQIALSDLSGNVRVQTNRLVVDGLEGKLNGGEVSVSGTMSAAEGGSGYSGSIAISGRRLTVEYPASVVSEFDADLRVVSPGPEGTTFGIVGKAAVRPGPVRSSIRQLAMMFASGPPVLPTPDVERRRRLMAMVGLDIELDTTEDIVADSNDFKAQLGGSVRVTGSLASPGMLGRLDIRDDGELFLVGRLYELKGGQIEFADANRIEPRLNVRAETRVSDYQIELQLTGPVERLDFRLRSNPPLSQGDLASLLTTGQTLKERREAGDDASDAARAQVLSAVSSEYLGAVGRWFGMDSVRIENSTRELSAVDVDPVARLSVTKKLGPLFEVVYSQSIETNDDIYWVITYDPGWHRLEAATKLTTQEGGTAEIRQELLLGAGSRPTHARQRARRRTARARVSDVMVTGVPEAEAREVAGKLHLSRGDRFDAYKWGRDKALIERYYRERDRLRTTVDSSRQPAGDGTGTALTYAVERGGLTRLRVEGHEFDGAALQALRMAWADSPIDEFVPEAVSDAARLALADAGYVQPQVKVEVVPSGEDAVAIVTITPGPGSANRTFSFTGNSTFRSDRLQVLLDEAGLGSQPWVTPSVVVGPLEAYYGAAGFLNLQVSPGRPRVEDNVATLPITIAEGTQFKVTAMEVTGARHASDAEVRTALGLDVGSTYTGLVSTDGVRRLTELYGRRGHSAAKVTVDTTFDRDASSAALRVTVDEGTRQVVQSVTTDGKDIVTRQRLVNRSIKVEPGKPVDSVTIEASQRRLYDLGTFSGVEPRFEPVGEPATTADGGVTQPVKVVFGVEEYPRYRLRYGFQVSTTTLTPQGDYTSGPAKPGVTVDLRRSNVFGTGVDAGIGGFLTRERYRARGLLSSATLGGRQIQNTLSVTKDYQNVTSSTVDLTANLLTISAEQRWRPRKRIEWAYGYNLEYQDIDVRVPGLDGDSFDFIIAARLASLFNYVSYDTRDNLFNPTRGMFHSANVEIGTPWVASELGYASYLGQHFFFVPVGRVRLASAVRFGTVGIRNSQENSLEASLVRFRTGGGTTVRGYRQDDLSPDPFEGIYYRGGDVLLVLNQEVRYTTWKWIELAAFVDAGNAFAEFKDFSLSGLEVGVGTGLRLTTPFGVVRLDVGFPRPRPDNYPLALWYFSFGQAF